jgi:hypothetical protein
MHCGALEKERPPLMVETVGAERMVIDDADVLKSVVGDLGLPNRVRESGATEHRAVDGEVTVSDIRFLMRGKIIGVSIPQSGFGAFEPLPSYTPLWSSAPVFPSSVSTSPTPPFPSPTPFRSTSPAEASASLLFSSSLLLPFHPPSPYLLARCLHTPIYAPTHLRAPPPPQPFAPPLALPNRIGSRDVYPLLRRLLRSNGLHFLHTCGTEGIKPHAILARLQNHQHHLLLLREKACKYTILMICQF